MTATTIRVQIATRKDTAANWTSANPTLLSGEFGFETDTLKLKVGDGSTNWNSLSYLYDSKTLSAGNTEAQVVDTGSDGHFKVKTEGTERLKIDSSGNYFIGSGQATDGGVISTVNFKGANDNSTPEDINYAALVSSVVDNADGAEDGRIQVQTISGGTLATRLDIDENKIGFFGATAAVQSTHVADLAATATTGTLPTADGTMTIADAASPTNAELLEYCRELEAKVNSLLAFASAHGLMASS